MILFWLYLMEPVLGLQTVKHTVVITPLRKSTIDICVFMEVKTQAAAASMTPVELAALRKTI